MDTHDTGEGLDTLLAVGVAYSVFIVVEGDTLDEADDVERDIADKGVDDVPVVGDDGRTLENTVANEIGVGKGNSSL